MLRVEHKGFECWSDGFRAQGADLVFISLFGNRNAVRAVWASLLAEHGRKGYREGVSLGVGGRYGDERFSLARGVDYTTVSHPLDDRQVHVVLVHPGATTKVSPFDPSFFLLGDTPTVQYWPRFNRMCRVPLRAGWREQVWDLGVTARLIHPLSGMGIAGHAIDVGDAWAEVVTSALREGVLS